MISYNDIIKISTLHNNKQHDELLEFIITKFPHTNILDLLHKIKQERFLHDTDAIKFNYNKKELVIYKDSFLTELPEYSEEQVIVDDITLTIGYPAGDFYSTAAFIKEIQYEDTILKIDKTNYHDIPISLINKCNKYIEKYLNKLNKSYLYFVNKEYSCGFLYCEEIITHITQLCFVHDVDILLEEQLCLMSHSGFNYTDFNLITYDQFRKYAKIYVKQAKREQAQYKQTNK